MVKVLLSKQNAFNIIMTICSPNLMILLCVKAISQIRSTLNVHFKLFRC